MPHSTLSALVTGGAGFIGSAIVRRLLEKGIRPVVLDDLSSGYEENLLAGTQFLRGDVRDKNLLGQAASGCRLIFHLAACVGNRRSSDDPATAAEVNVMGTVNVLEIARRKGIGRVVFASSAAVYGEPQALPIAEQHAQNPVTPYGAGKLAAEKMCLAYNAHFGMRNICLRYFNVYGPGQRYDSHGNVIPIFFHRVFRGEAVVVYGDGGQSRDFVHVADAAEATIEAAIRPVATGAFNIGSGGSVTILELARMVMAAAGTETRVEFAPARAGDVRDALADVATARIILGYSPSVGLPEGLRDYLAWVRKDAISLRSQERLAP